VGEAVATAGIVLIIFWVGAALALGVAWRGVRRHNEVSARRPLRPPLRWLAAPGLCGRLHRRLRGAVAALRVAVPAPRRSRRAVEAPSSLVPIADEIEAHALALDRQLVVADCLRGPRAMVVRRALARQVDDVEQLAHRVAAAAMASSQPGGEPTPAALERIAEQLDALDAARAEIARLEADAGLGVRI
jgi:hypothetical protein